MDFQFLCNLKNYFLKMYQIILIHLSRPPVQRKGHYVVLSASGPIVVKVMIKVLKAGIKVISNKLVLRTFATNQLKGEKNLIKLASKLLTLVK